MQAALLERLTVIDLSITPMTPLESTTATATMSPDAVLTELLETHVPSMYRLARSIVHESGLAEDVVQESLIKAWQAASGFRGDASVRSWALRITHNTAISMLRKRREELHDPAVMPESKDQPTGLDRQVQGRMMVDELWVALDKLDPLSRTITVLREIEGMTYEEIGEALDLPLPTVKTRLFRARKQLSGALEEWR
jgi:RNA polymerase sigma-70 factor, ECF subfamily